MTKMLHTTSMTCDRGRWKPQRPQKGRVAINSHTLYDRARTHTHKHTHMYSLVLPTHTHARGLVVIKAKALGGWRSEKKARGPCPVLDPPLDHDGFERQRMTENKGEVT